MRKLRIMLALLLLDLSQGALWWSIHVAPAPRDTRKALQAWLISQHRAGSTNSQ